MGRTGGTGWDPRVQLGVLCYATSTHPRARFIFRGSIVRAALRLRGRLFAYICRRGLLTRVFAILLERSIGLPLPVFIYGCFRYLAEAFCRSVDAGLVEGLNMRVVAIRLNGAFYCSVGFGISLALVICSCFRSSAEAFLQ